jgi:hypothetical protein
MSNRAKEQIKIAFTDGIKEMQELGLDKDIKNWSPVHLYIYYSAVFTAIILSWAIFFPILFLMFYILNQ